VRRLSTALAGFLLAAGIAGPALAQDLCAELTLPPALDLSCTPVPELAQGAVAVAPVGGTFAALSRMTVRPLVREGEDALAWRDPAAWLRRQMTMDTAGYADLLSGLAGSPDSPFAGESARGALDSLKSALGSMGRLPLTACDEPSATIPDRQWDMRCSFTAGGLGLLMHLRLVAAGEERWALTMRAANEQRLRHFEAIANSFAPD
jgi:hypothetical protein